MRLNVPSCCRAGPVMISCSVPFCVVRTRAPRGSDGWNVAIPQWKPWPGASYARASGEPTITASAPQAIAFATSPPLRMPPSAITLQYSPVSSMCCARAAATSAIAVACGTPMPSTPRVVHAAPGPTPTSTPTAPVPIRCKPGEELAQPPLRQRTGRPPPQGDVTVVADALRRERAGGDDALGLDLAHALGHQLRFYGL